MTDPENGKPGEGAEIEKSQLDAELTANTTAVDLEIDPDDSKAHLINANGGARGSDHIDVKIIDGTAASSEGEVSFNGLGKDEVMKYADEPFWKRLRWILFILFWVGWFAMLVTAIVIIAVAPRCPPRPDLKWYQTETVYQVLPESYKDSNDDGYGDFEGLSSKMDYINDDLGAKVVWISNPYKTDGIESELGILDHKAVSDRFGAKDLKAWMKSLQKEGKKVVLDFVPNQTSKNHTWFQKSRKGEEKYKNYYVWKKTSDSSTPPNNWKTLDGKAAWTFDTVRQEWYFHQFGSDYPDLNLANEAVVEEMEDIMGYWFSMGVSGFHIKDVAFLVENPDFADDDAENTQTRNYQGTFEFLTKLRSVADRFSDKPGRERVLFGTVYSVHNKTSEYYGSKDGDARLHIVVPVLEDLKESCKAQCVLKMVQELLEGAEDAEVSQWLGLQLGNQYIERIASRQGEDVEKLHAAHALQLLLPGTPFNYYGDEYGQFDGVVAQKIASNDNHRTPMQWDNGPNAGFTSKGVTPWLPIGAKYKSNNLKAGDALFTSQTPLKAFKELVELRGEESFQFGVTKLCAPNENLLMFTRSASRFPSFLVMMNLGDGPVYVSLKNQECVATKEEGTVRFHSRDSDQVSEVHSFHDNDVKLAKGDVVVIEFEEDEAE